MKPLLQLALVTAALVAWSSADEALDEKVPWSGIMRNVTLGELTARMQGWSETTVGIDFALAEPLDKELSATVLDRLEVPDNPRPTFGELLRLAYKSAGQKVVLSEGERGIVVTRLLARSFRLPFVKLERMQKTGAFGEAAIKGEMTRKGWKISPHFVVTTKASGALLVEGTREDLDAMERFLGL